MKVGRNDPCPCGSGKKYKKCCLSKDEASARQAAKGLAETVRALEVNPPNFPRQFADFPELPELPEPKPLSPEDEARVLLWEEFEDAESDALPALFRRGLAEHVLDDELTFEMLTAIYDEGPESAILGLLDELRLARPDLYQASEAYYLQWQIADAVDNGRVGQIPELAAAMAGQAGIDLDTFYAVRDHLAYHGHLALVADMMQQAWPLVRDSDEYLEGADVEFAAEGQQLTLLAYLARADAPRTNDPELITELERFAPVDGESLSDLFALLTGGSEDTWDRAGRLDDEQINRLSLRFQGELWRAEGVALSRGELARTTLVIYIADRRAGRIGRVAHPPKAKGKPQATGTAAAASLLVPDRTTLNHFLSQMFDPLTSAYYEAIATLELTPAWLRFLQAQELITAEQRAAAMKDLRRLVLELAPIWGQRGADPAVGANIKAAWERDDVPDAA